MGAAVAEDPAAFDKRLCVQMQNLCAYGARRADPAERRDQDDQMRGGAAKKRCQNDEGNELWKQNKNLNKTIENLPDPAAEAPQNPDTRPQNQRQNTAQDADQQRLPCAIDKLGQNIIAHRVCAEQMLPAYGEPLREQLFLSVARKKSGCKRGERKNGQQQESQNERQKSFLSHPLPSNLRLGSRSRHKKSVSRIDSTMMHVVTNKMPCMSG